jgi:ribosome-binding factor A
MPDANRTKFRKEHLTESIKNYAGDFFARNTSGGSMITVTNVWITDDNKKADIYLSIMPESKSEAAINFAKRQRTELQKYLFTKIRLSHLPFLDIILDKSGNIYDKLRDSIKK